ncbi:hypothetical protein P3W45_000427 [Vairimorpha bombi]|jgi:diphthine-ammonia ligase
MKFVALVSGGKDSVYSIQLLKSQGHTPVGLLYMYTEDEYVDSYMYQTVGSEIVKVLGKCLELPLFEYKTKCLTINKDLDYIKIQDDEVEDLYNALSEIRNKIDFEGVSSGAILSRYQKNRVENVSRRLGLISLAPLWHRNQKDLLGEMINSGIKAVLVKVASSFLDRSWLGKDIRFVYDLNTGLDDNYCGEGGEYETVVLDCDIFKYRIEFKESSIHCHPDETLENATVFFMRFGDIYLENK